MRAQTGRELRGIDQAILEAALMSFEHRKTEIEDRINYLRTKLKMPSTMTVAGSNGSRVGRERRKMTAAGRARIIAAQKARWAKEQKKEKKERKEKKVPVVMAAGKKDRHVSLLPGAPSASSASSARAKTPTKKLKRGK